MRRCHFLVPITGLGRRQMNLLTTSAHYAAIEALVRDREAHREEVGRLQAAYRALVEPFTDFVIRSDRLETARDALLVERDALTLQRDALSVENNAVTRALGDLMAERDALTAENGTILARLDALVTDREALIVERDTLLGALVTERDALIVERDALIVERNDLIVERDVLLASHSWRITAPLRGAGAVLRKLVAAVRRTGNVS